MSVEGLVGTIVVVLLGIGFILLPYIRQRSSQSAVQSMKAQKERDELVTTYERVLSTIRDLDEDFNTGKLAEGPYQQERAYWSERGVEILQHLQPDADRETRTQPAQAEKPVMNGNGKLMDDAVEQAIRAYREATHSKA